MAPSRANPPLPDRRCSPLPSHGNGKRRASVPPLRLFITISLSRSLNRQDARSSRLRRPDNAAQPILDQNDVEVHQDAKSASRQLQVSQQLCLVDRQETLNRLNFDDDKRIDKQVKEKAEIHANVAIEYRNCNLALDRHISGA